MLVAGAVQGNLVRDILRGPVALAVAALGVAGPQLVWLEPQTLEAVVEPVAIVAAHTLVARAVLALSLFLMLAHNNLVVAQSHQAVETLFTHSLLVVY